MAREQTAGPRLAASVIGPAVCRFSAAVHFVVDERLIRPALLDGGPLVVVAGLPAAGFVAERERDPLALLDLLVGRDAADVASHVLPS